MLKESENFKQVNLDAARQLADLLHQARLASGEEIANIARCITLSKKQIRGIELVEFTSFISSTYYFLAAKKYAKYLKVEFDFDSLSNTEVVPPPIHSDTPAQRKEQSKRSKVKVGIARKEFFKKKIFIATLAIPLLLVFVSKAIMHQPKFEENQMPFEEQVQLDPPASQIAAEITQPLQAEVAPSSNISMTTDVQTNGDEIRLEFVDTNWIQVIYRNDERVQKTYAAGEVLTLKRSELKGLVLGNAIAVKVIVSNKEQDISPFVTSSSNVAKLFGEGLRSIGK